MATISNRQRAEIAQYMDLDFTLCDLANEYLDASLDKSFPDATERQQYIDDFRNRCKLKKRRQRITYAFGKIENTIKSGLKRIVQLF